MELLLLEENSEISFKIQNNKIFFNTNTMATQWSTKSNPFSLYLPILYHPFSFPLLRFLPNSSSSAAAAKLLQPCPTLCDLRDGSPPGSCVPGILQARTLEWVAVSFSNAWKWKVKVKSLSRVRLLATSWTAAYQAPPSMGFARQEYWSGMPLHTKPNILFSGSLQKRCIETWGKLKLL